MEDLKTNLVGDVNTLAGLALAAVGLVWLIACANASNLLIARVTSRRQELAVRAALGATRGRVLRYLLAESVVLATGAVALGVGVAWAGMQLLQTQGATYFPRTQEIRFDAPMIWLMAGLAISSALIFGLVPALHATGGSVDASLRSGRTVAGGAGVRRLRRSLVAAQFAIATPLLIVAALLLTSLERLRQVDLGFEAAQLLTGSIRLPGALYSDNARVNAFWEQLQRRVEALPGVAAVAFADGLPPNTAGQHNNFDLEQYPTPSGRVAAGHALGGGDAGVRAHARPDAGRRPLARRTRSGAQRGGGGAVVRDGRSRVGAAVLPQRKRRRQAVARRRLHHLSVDHAWSAW